MACDKAFTQDFEDTMVAKGVFTRKTYDLRKKEPREGYTPKRHCKEFGHSFQKIQETEDNYGMAWIIIQCRVCEKTDTYYDTIYDDY